MTQFPTELLVAMMFLISPVEPKPSDVLAHANIPMLIEVAVQLEILDRREIGYMLNRHDNLHNDLIALRQRYQGLKNAPFISDSLRFPDRDTISNLLVFNREYLKYCESNLAMAFSNHREEWEDIIRETNQLYAIWDAVRDCRCEHFYVTTRREALLKLRGMIDEESYHSGSLPPFVPIWRFHYIER